MDAALAAEEVCVVGDPSCVPCHVCNGTGVVSYEGKFEYSEMPCPCCLGKGTVRQGRNGNLLSSLLSLDMD